MLVVIHSAYADGCETVALNEMEEPSELTEGFWDGTVFPLTGDGNHASLTSIETATILEAASQSLVGRSREWEG